MQRVVQRFSLSVVVVFLLGVFAIAVSSAILAWSYRDQLTGLRHTIYARCQQRLAYDEASQRARSAQETYYRALLVNLSRHPSPQSAAFNAQLVRNVRHVVIGLQAALDNGAPKGCTAFR